MLYPNSEMVMVEWIRSLPGIHSGRVATLLPGDVSAWSETGFVQVLSLGGAPNRDHALRAPALQISCWGANPDSTKTPWAKTSELAERIWAGFYDPEFFPYEPTLPAAYSPARVLTGYTISEPRKILGDASGFAHVTFDATLRWVIR